jgi:hypothetical protein
LNFKVREIRVTSIRWNKDMAKEEGERRTVATRGREGEGYRGRSPDFDLLCL